eukprot:5770894-Alexandrium_andersonii.AAC.1
MSASLVGSEMCIRDSASTAHGTAHVHRANARACARVLIRARACICIPVSYTHLTLPTICSV